MGFKRHSTIKKVLNGNVHRITVRRFTVIFTGSGGLFFKGFEIGISRFRHHAHSPIVFRMKPTICFICNFFCGSSKKYLSDYCTPYITDAIMAHRNSEVL